MNKIIVILALAMILVMPAVVATDVGSGIGISVTTQKFAPRVWMCDSRTTIDDNTENGQNGLSLAERKHNYAFEGESIHWTVLVMDKNKIEEVTEVVGTIGQSQGAGNDVEVECIRRGCDEQRTIPAECAARIDQFVLTTCDSDTMSFYDCSLTVETPASMHGEYFITIEAMDLTGLSGTMAENEYWFLNPTIALAVDGNLAFEDVMPGTLSYSNTILVGNDAEAGSGVILDMFISGTDFYDPTSSGARCSNDANGIPTNKLALIEFSYFVTNGAYVSGVATFDTDAEGYTNIPYSTEISGAERIMRWRNGPRGAAPSSDVVEADWNNGNALSPGSEMALTFKLDMPEPCVGDFSEGQIYFWGEAI
ncbi:hypothetical protein J4218_00210 [Candidatus Pacearchaeota archaeon]|nr:hypothetical protein [Candidatus Pacearchaeota archaeon]